jgi:SNF2 family DNA or RNA helicase
MINITVKNADKLYDEHSAFLSFPYDNTLVSIMRAQSNRFWHSEKKEWEVPAKALPTILNQIKGHEIIINGMFDAAVLAAPKEVKLPAGFNFKTKPFEHQMEGLMYGLEHDKFLLGDEQGLGKTKQVIDIAVARKKTHGYKHCLIVCCVNGLKWNWYNEISTHSNESAWILGSRFKGGKHVIGSVKDRLTDLNSLGHGLDSYFLITNVETLRDEAVCSKVKELCDKGIIEMVAIDEIHKCKNPASQQGKAILKLQPKTRIAMTGTPLMNKPLDLFVTLKWLSVERHSFFQFKKHYCVFGGYGGYEIVGYKNLSDLHAQLQENMLRRLKKDRLDLPDKIYTTEYVEMTAAQAKLYKEVRDEVKNNIDKIKMSNNPLAMLIRMRQATGYTGILSSTVHESAKLDRMEELVEEVVESGGKCLVFSNWTDVTTPAFQRLRQYNPAIITGETKDADRKVQEQKFMKDATCSVIVGTIGAMGTGLTLTAGTTVIFLDEPWNRANKEQAEDRAHRIGTKSNVNIITLVCKDTIDERINELVYKKGKMADMLVDGKLEASAKESIDFLLS